VGRRRRARRRRSRRAIGPRTPARRGRRSLRRRVGTLDELRDRVVGDLPRLEVVRGQRRLHRRRQVVGHLRAPCWLGSGPSASASASSASPRGDPPAVHPPPTPPPPLSRVAPPAVHPPSTLATLLGGGDLPRSPRSAPPAGHCFRWRERSPSRCGGAGAGGCPRRRVALATAVISRSYEEHDCTACRAMTAPGAERWLHPVQTNGILRIPLRDEHPEKGEPVARLRRALPAPTPSLGRFSIGFGLRLAPRRHHTGASVAN
jgi:hypothetical protein